ncbi:MAG: DUF5684 domain-containing protein [Oscillospiraceae bacterium]|nr:DUF5684 domain-containing protein [Oscillospiraceae bacterium]
MSQEEAYDAGYEAGAGLAELLSSGVSNVVSLAIGILSIVALWFLFTKAGKEGWKAIIPFLNCYEEYDIVYGNGWKCLLLLVPILNIAVSIMFSFRLAQAYGKGTGFAILTIFFPQIMMLIMAFDSNTQYVGPCDKFL